MFNLLIKTGRGRVKIKTIIILSVKQENRLKKINQLIVLVNCSQTLVTCIKARLIVNPGSRQRGTTIGSCPHEYADRGPATCQL